MLSSGQINTRPAPGFWKSFTGPKTNIKYDANGVLAPNTTLVSDARAMKQLVPLLSLTTRRVFCLVVVAVVALIAIRFTPTTQANRNQSGVEMPARLVSPPNPLPALTLTVNTLGDQADASVGNGVCDVDIGTSGAQCTLRAAIQEANAVFGADTIGFSMTGTINLTGALPTLASEMTITGPGSTLLTVRRDTGGDYRIFTISNATVSISGLTVTNGKTPDGVSGNVGAPGGEGGGIWNSGNLVLSDVTITNNRTGNGGAGTTRGGSAGNGAGIFNSGTLTATNCSVTGNTGGQGGDGTTAGGDGGAGAGVSNYYATLTMTSCTVTGNTGGKGGVAGNSGGRGGSGAGVYIFGAGVLNLTNLNISNNTAGDSHGNGLGGLGGGIMSDASTSTIVLTNSTVSGNRAGLETLAGGDGYGGGIYSAGALFVSGSTISGNSRASFGGGLLSAGALRMTNSTVSGNSAGTGGGILAGDASITNCTITNNFATQQAHGVMSASSQTRVRNTIIAYNGTGGAGPDTDGTFVSQGHNLIGYPAPGPMGASHGFTGPGDQVGTAGAPLNPHLGPLANNGGPRNTHALLTASTALDAGDDCVTQVAHCGDSTISQLTTDQRGPAFNRIVDGPDANTTATVDIGAYEKQAVFPNLPDATTNEDTPAVVAFDLNDIASVTSVTATSSNSALVPNANINVVLANSTAILTISPAANLIGTTDITVTVNRTGGSASDTFALTVAAVHDAPSFTKGADQSVNENDPAQTVNNWATAISAGPADESGQAVTFQIVSNSNASLFSVAPAISSNGTLTYTPATGMSGTALITIRLIDNGGTANGGSDTSATQSFNINVLEGGNLHFSSFSYNVSEGGSSALITVSRSGGSAGEARINYATSNGTATAGQDYTSTSDTLTFANGVTSQTFSVPILGDTVDESDFESISLTLSNPAGSGGLGSPSTSTLNINDDDPRPTVSIDDVQLVEGNSGMTGFVFTVTLTGQTALQATVSFATSNNTATLSDYQATSGQVTFNPGETTKTITVPVVGDTLGEANETFFVNLNFSTNSTIIRFRGTGTILNDDTSVQFNSPTYSPSESFVSVSFTVNRTGITTGSSTVNYATSDTGSATCGTANGNASSQCDYSSRSGTLSFAPGETSKTFNVPFVDDGWLEGNESFTLTLSSPGGATLGSPATAIVNIVDNDLAGAIPSLFFEPGTSRAIALNSVTFVGGPFRVMDPLNFSADGQTRLLLYTSNLRLTHVDPAYLTVQAATVVLPIEKVGTVSGVPGLDASYIIVKLPAGLPTGDLQLIVTLRGHPSTGAVLQIVP